MDLRDWEAETIVRAGSGNDLIMTGRYNSTVYGGDGDDIISAGNGNDILHGDAGDDVVIGMSGEIAFMAKQAVTSWSAAMERTG